MNVELDGAILNGFPHNAKSGTFKSIVSIGDGTHLLKFSNTKAPVVQHYEVGFKDVSLLPVDDFGSDS